VAGVCGKETVQGKNHTYDTSKCAYYSTRVRPRNCTHLQRARQVHDNYNIDAAYDY